MLENIYGHGKLVKDNIIFANVGRFKAMIKKRTEMTSSRDGDTKHIMQGYKAHIELIDVEVIEQAPMHDILNQVEWGNMSHILLKGIYDRNDGLKEHVDIPFCKLALRSFDYKGLHKGLIREMYLDADMVCATLVDRIRVHGE